MGPKAKKKQHLTTETPGIGPTRTIVVNGRIVPDITAQTLSYAAIAEIAKGDNYRPDIAYSVLIHNKETNVGSSLAIGESVPVVEGMIVNVTGGD
jgi:hypothetical protein